MMLLMLISLRLLTGTSLLPIIQMVMLTPEITTECGGRPDQIMVVYLDAREWMPTGTMDFTGMKEDPPMTNVVTLIMDLKPGQRLKLSM